jgi:hypothetical protein
MPPEISTSTPSSGCAACGELSWNDASFGSSSSELSRMTPSSTSNTQKLRQRPACSVMSRRFWLVTAIFIGCSGA